MVALRLSQARLEGFAPFRRLATIGHVLDWKTIVELPEPEFVQRVIGEMTRYFFEHGAKALEEEQYLVSVGKSGLRPICCSDCHNPISGPANMRRFYGNTLHGDCLVRRWGEERSGEVEYHGRSYPVIAYWDRLTRLNDVIKAA